MRRPQIKGLNPRNPDFIFHFLFFSFLIMALKAIFQFFHFFIFGTVSMIEFFIFSIFQFFIFWFFIFSIFHFSSPFPLVRPLQEIDRYLRTTNCSKLGVRPFLRSAVSPNIHTLKRYLMRGTLIGSCGGLEFDSYNPFHEAIDTSGPPTALN